MTFRHITPDFYLRDPVALAPQLLGTYLIRQAEDGPLLAGRIVETEAYCQDDPASHSFRGRTARTSVMFEAGGRAYVYFIYGMYDCFNVVAGPEGYGGAVLVRALEPVEGIEGMWRNRFADRAFDPKKIHELCSGPGKLCRALDIRTKRDNGKPLQTGDLRLMAAAAPEGSGSGGPGFSVGVSKRIGIRKAAEKPWRFYIEGSRFVSRR
jgi:DNA-3-methyladenine glycosylase